MGMLLIVFLDIFSPHILKKETVLIWLSEAHDEKVSHTELPIWVLSIAVKKKGKKNKDCVAGDRQFTER